MKNQGKNSWSRIMLLGLVAIMLLLGIGVSSLAFAQAPQNQIVVDYGVDNDKKNDGKCTLREAIIVANNGKASSGKPPNECKIVNPNPGLASYTIVVNSSATPYTLTRNDSGSEDSSTTGDLDVRANITITSATPLIIQAGQGFSDRIFHILPGGKLTLDQVAIRGGNPKDNGAGIFVDGGELNLSNATLTKNSAGTSGGALYNTGTAVLNHVTIKGNTAPTGSAYTNNGGSLTLQNTLIDGGSCSGAATALGVNLAYPVDNTPGADCPGETNTPLLLTAFPDANLPEYFKLDENSPALDSADNTYCPAEDQIGLSRPQPNNGSGICDIGAIERLYVNQPPVANDDTPDPILEDSSGVAVDVASNDSDPEGFLDLTSVEVVTGSEPQHGTATANDDGTITYVPAPHYSGSDSFVYQICDSEGDCDTATVWITVESDQTIEVINLCDLDQQVPAQPVPGSLRWAIDLANNNNFHDSGIDRIVFDLYEDDCGTNNVIELNSALPALTDPVIIDGLGFDEHPGSFVTTPPSTPYVTLDGNAAGFSGLIIQADAADTAGSTITNLILTDFSGDGIVIEGTGELGPGSTIDTNTISGSGGSGIVIGSPTNPADGNLLQNNTIDANCGSGILIYGFEADPPTLEIEQIAGNQIIGNIITLNGACGLTDENGIPLNDGITIPFGQNNEITGNEFSGNTELNVDLGGDGPTANDIDDPDGGPNYTQNYPWLLSATPAGEITGYLNSVPGQDFTLQFFVSASCDNSLSNSTPLSVDPVQFATDGDGNVLFSTTVQAPDSLNYGQAVNSTATDALGNTSEYSNCIEVDDDNTVWTNSMQRQSGTVVNQKINQQGQSRWYKFWVSPNSRITLNLSNLPENYDLAVFGDIGQAYAELVGDANLDLNRLDAEFPTDAFAPSTFSPSTFSPSTFSPSTFSPSTFSPSTFSPSTFSPSTFSPDVYSPSTFSPSTFSPSTFSPSTFSPSTFSPSTFSGNAYSAAQMTTLIAVSGNDGQANEEITFNSYNNQGWFYARVRGSQGVFNEEIGFDLGLDIDGGVCEGIQEDFGHPALLPVADSGRETVILVDWSRMGLSDPNNQDRMDLEAKLVQLAAHSSVNGVIVDLSEMVGGQPKYPQVFDSNNQADQFNDEDGSGTFYRLCPYGKNIVADAIKEVVDSYRVNNPVKYVVIVGDDNVIPYYRIPDQALLGPEEDYVVPVDLDSSSEASLRNNYFLSQDGYGATVNLAMNNNTMPLPNIAIGRVLETPGQIINIIDAYLEMPVLQPQSALITAYDFLTDNGLGVRDVLAGDGFITIDQDLLVANPDTWTAGQLKNKLDTVDFDLAFLAGHFSANETLAADYETKYSTLDFLNSPLDLRNAIVFSGGCHSGYNIVNEHAIPGYTIEPDWPAVMAEKGITLVAGTGYQYGDTDFLEYSERLYLEFTRQLRSDVSQNISVGDALVRAKKQYLIDTPQMRGIHQKSLLQATIYGLPMTSVNMQGQRLDLSSNGSTLTTADLLPVDDLPAVSTEPGEVFGLQYYDLVRNYNLNEVSKTLVSVEDETQQIEVTYLENGPGGVVANAAEPVLPLDSFNATVANSNLVVRGIGFLEGSYRDFSDRIPLMGAPTTEVSASHFDFLSFVFYPQQMWSINRYDTLLNGSGSTILNITPAQNRSEQITLPGELQTATQRRFDSLKLRLFYLPENFLDTVYVGSNRPDVASAPTIVSVQAQPDGNNVVYEALVVGDPSVGVQSVWVSYTELSSPTASGNDGQWQSLSLTQDPVDSRIWRGTLSNVANPQDQRFIVQAVNGSGLVTLSNNKGRFFIPGVTGQATSLVETSGPVPRKGQIGTAASFSADLDLVGGTGSEDLSGLPILFSIGEDLRLGWTNSNGEATVSIPILGTPPGFQPVTISFPGSAIYEPSATDSAPFEVLPADTSIVLDPETVYVTSLQPDVALYATLKDGQDRPLAEKSVTFTISGAGSTIQKAVITNPEGRAQLGVVNLPVKAEYTVTARFDGTGSYNPSTTTASSMIKFNDPPVCDNVEVTTFNNKVNIWPSNNNLVDLKLEGATDPNGDALSYYFLQIYQDEPLTGVVDGTITNGCSDAEARASRDGGGDGRVYHVTYLVDDGKGGTCTGEALIGVSHDQSDPSSYDGGPLFNSLGAGVPACTP
jgi:CSLREA domain-containing protein